MSASWVTMTMVIPRSRLSCGEQVHDLAAAGRVQVARGLVRQQHGGSVTMARAMATRCCWPPDSSPGVWVSQPVRPTDARACGRWACRSARRDAAVDQGQFHVLQGRGAVEEVEALEDEAQVVRGAAGPAGRGSARRPRRPRTGTTPLSAYPDSPRMFMQVDLPEPLGPMTATNSPSSIRRSTPRRACTAAWPVP